MSISTQLLQILACPECRKELDLASENLLCRHCGLQFEIRNGVPNLIVQTEHEEDPPDIDTTVDIPMNPLYKRLNVIKIGPLFIPNTNYTLMKKWRQGELSLIQKLRLKMMRHGPAFHKTAELHSRAFEEIASFAAQLPSSENTILPEIDEYSAIYPKQPSLILFKALEGLMFRKLVKPEYCGEMSLEIGVSDALVSNLHFKGKNIQFGTEYCTDRLYSEKHSGKLLFSSDVRKLPLKEGLLKAIFMVHIFDDLEFDMEEALKEISRVLAPGGLLVFSSSTDKFLNGLTYDRIKKIVDIPPKDYENYRKHRYQKVNLKSKNELNEKLNESGFEIQEYQEFLAEPYAWAWDLGMAVETSWGATLLSRLKSENEKTEMMNKIKKTFSSLCRHDAELSAKSGGAHCFCIARKKQS